MDENPVNEHSLLITAQLWSFWIVFYSNNFRSVKVWVVLLWVVCVLQPGGRFCLEWKFKAMIAVICSSLHLTRFFLDFNRKANLRVLPSSKWPPVSGLFKPRPCECSQFARLSSSSSWAGRPGTQPSTRCLTLLPSQFSQQSLHLVCTGAGPLLAPPPRPPPPPSSTILFFSCFLQAVAALFASRLSVNLSFPLLPRIYFAAFLLQLCHSRGFPLLHSSTPPPSPLSLLSSLDC